MPAKNFQDSLQENRGRKFIDELNTEMPSSETKGSPDPKVAEGHHRVAGEGTYSHIYNRGVEKRIIFGDAQDYEVFLGYLKDYLTAPADSESAKKTFTVNGRIFRGVPHQPKNYLDKVELIAYSLMPNHFHLLLHQKTHGSLEGFIRSLCTRYSMYFNKKYERSGALFEGPYKSVQIKDVSSLLFLTRYLHHSPKENSKNLTDGYSSYAEYLGLRETSWVKPKVVLSFFDKSENNSFKGAGGYKNFVEKYELAQKEAEALEGITLESTSQHLERRVPELAHTELSPETQPDSDLKPGLRIPEFIATAAVFLLLVGLGVRNIKASASKSSNPPPTPIESSPTPLVSGVSSTPSQTEEIKPRIILVVKIKDGAEYVNIRLEPTTHSEKIGEAKEGETFEEFVAVDSEWYEIKLADGSTGFISTRYVEEVEQRENQTDSTLILEDENGIDDASFAVNEVKSADIASSTITASALDDMVNSLNVGGATLTWDIGASTGTDTINNDVDFILLETENSGIASTLSATTATDVNGTFASVEKLTITSSVTTDTTVNVDDIRLTHNIVDATDKSVLFLQNADDAGVAAETFEAIFALENNDANEAVADAIVFTAQGVDVSDFTRGINFDAANFTIEIVLENAEALYNQTDGTITSEDRGVGDYATFTTSTATFNADPAVNGATSADIASSTATASVFDTVITLTAANGVSTFNTDLDSSLPGAVGGISYNISALTSTIYDLNLVNANNATSTSVVDAFLFSNDQATEISIDEVTIGHNDGSGTLTNGLQIENTTEAGTITNAINAEGLAISLAELQIFDNNIETNDIANYNINEDDLDFTEADIHFAEIAETMTWNAKTSSTAFDGMTFEVIETLLVFVNSDANEVAMNNIVFGLSAPDFTNVINLNRANFTIEIIEETNN